MDYYNMNDVTLGGELDSVTQETANEQEFINEQENTNEQEFINEQEKVNEQQNIVLQAEEAEVKNGSVEVLARQEEMDGNPTEEMGESQPEEVREVVEETQSQEVEDSEPEEMQGGQPAEDESAVELHSAEPIESSEVEDAKPIKVYVKRNEQGIITDINSDIFIDDLNGWEYFDEGFGDRYAHAQSQYFDDGVMDENGNYLHS